MLLYFAWIAFLFEINIEASFSFKFSITKNIQTCKSREDNVKYLLYSTPNFRNFISYAQFLFHLYAPPPWIILKQIIDIILFYL